MESLADFLGVGDTEHAPDTQQPDYTAMSAKDFALAVLNSQEFRLYIVAGFRLGSLPSAIVTRLMDYGWGKPPDRMELTGKDGGPIEQVSEVRRVVVRPQADEDKTEKPAAYTTH